MTAKRKPDWAQKKANRMYRAWRASGRPVPAATIARALREAYRRGYKQGYVTGTFHEGGGKHSGTVRIYGTPKEGVKNA